MTKRYFVASAAAVAATAGMAHAQAFAESFDDVTTLPASGWFQQNNSSPLGTLNWEQGDTTVFGSQATAGYIFADYLNGANLATISDWLVTPVRTFQNGHTLAFWTRTVDGPVYPDRLQVRLSTAGSSTNVGSLGDPNAVGDFTTLLLDINPTYTTSGYPNTWTQFVVVLSGLPAGGASGRLAFRYFVENAGPSGANSDYIGLDEVEYTPGGIVTGGCCLPNGSCSVTTPASCTSQSGTYRGDNTNCINPNCPQPGACCFATGLCSLSAAAQCTIAGGVYSGNGTACGNCPQPAGGWGEQVDAGDLPSTAMVITGSGPLNQIDGVLSGAGDADMYQFQMCSPASFSASTTGSSGTLQDSQLFLFGPDGHGIASDDDDPAGSGFLSALSSTFTSALSPGLYYIAISGYDHDPVDSGTQEIWADTPFNVERAPDGPGAANPIAAWNGLGDSGGYTISLTGACKVSGTSQPCYPNCDHSTVQPCLNTNDFICFLNKFSAADTYANCDNSTVPPVLNTNDFICFLNKFAAGCSNC